MKTYVVKVALRGISPMVWRRFRLSGETSLAAFHYIIQIAQGITFTNSVDRLCRIKRERYQVKADLL
ncbi:IS1096 element passenger TnpR family protein [Xenorhabdus bovienii]|uniref:IS1096 element passenger TnpR family protein n=1 Tax=Xenorhabdus bovienii TaxID=40576 RepID=UPI0023B347D9|nr:hypothetical protein [Xenorhabdus bovienii]MDE9545351.1 plasmid pRiA4b ORF-3 family protein [Xenorhabdus bovienii]